MTRLCMYVECNFNLHIYKNWHLPQSKLMYGGLTFMCLVLTVNVILIKNNILQLKLVIGLYFVYFCLLTP